MKLKNRGEMNKLLLGESLMNLSEIEKKYYYLYSKNLIELIKEKTKSDIKNIKTFDKNILENKK